LTEKTLDTFRYALQTFPQFDYLVKVDDDTFVRVDRMISILANITASRAYIGYFHINSPRYVEGYKNNEIFYPEFMEHVLPFASGCAYSLSRDLVRYIINQEPYLTKYYNEDVSVGTWLFPVQLTRYHEEDFVYLWHKCPERAVFMHPTKPQDMLHLYQNSHMPETCFCDGIFPQLAPS